MNSSFSPTPVRSWDCSVTSEGLLHLSNGSSLSSNSRGSRRRLQDGSYATNNYSVSDSAVLCPDSPQNCISGMPWTPPMTNARGQLNDSHVPRSRLQGSRNLFSAKKPLSTRTTSSPSIHGSQSAHLMATQSDSHRKWSFSFGNHSLSNQGFCPSNAVYPVMFQNPVSQSQHVVDIPSTSRPEPDDDQSPPPPWMFYRSNMEYKFHKAIKELQRLEQSPELSFSSRREGFRWNPTNDNDSPFDVDILDHMEMYGFHSPNYLMADQSCFICGKLLSQRSPYSSENILQGHDAPTVGVLSCCHVFHADCLEQVTQKTKAHDPSCPVCSNHTGSAEESPYVLKSNHTALRNSHGNKWTMHRDEPWNSRKGRAKRAWRSGAPEQDGNGSRSLTSHLKKHFTFKGRGVNVSRPSNFVDRNNSTCG